MPRTFNFPIKQHAIGAQQPSGLRMTASAAAHIDGALFGSRELVTLENFCECEGVLIRKIYGAAKGMFANCLNGGVHPNCL
jgi:hypothetical protein